MTKFGRTVTLRMLAARLGGEHCRSSDEASEPAAG
jgi:hypothetical protein